jgi:hypothetical protein
MRGNPPQYYALAERLEYEWELSVLQVSQAAVNQATRYCGRAAAHIVLLENDDAQAA